MAPILIIQGDKDEYGTIKQVEAIYNKAPNKNNSYLMLKNCEHSPHLSSTDAVIRSINRFILLQKHPLQQISF